jgi:hypothetical protein
MQSLGRCSTHNKIQWRHEMARTGMLALGLLLSMIASEAQEPVLGSNVYRVVLLSGCNKYSSGFLWQRDARI